VRKALPFLLSACGAPALAASVPATEPIPVAPVSPGGSTVPVAPDPTATPFSGATTSPEPRVDRACPNDMASVDGFCMDHYEAPNVRGEFPLALQTAYDGETWCAARGKRLCTENEWVRACEGTRGRRFPYGAEHRLGACNDDRTWQPVHWNLLATWPASPAVDEARRLYQADRSGVRAACISEEGVYDLTGNVAEWVRRSDPAPHAGYDHVLKGCYWAGCYHDPQPNCTFANHAHPGSFRTYEAGFRCCSDAAP
jgi:formylglycine-generating enzyme required for sulfatase activity